MQSRRLLIPSVVTLAVLAAGCGAAPPRTGPAGAPDAAHALAYARCMRSHGVPGFPDPAAGGDLPKPQVVSARKGDPARFDSAAAACRRALPDGGNGETAAEIARDWSAFRGFARCMRSHGVPSWPDPTSRSPSDHRPTFAIAALGLDGTSPSLRAKAQRCASLLHLDGLPSAH